VKLGIYINADDIEERLRRTHSLSLPNLNISFDTEDIQAYFKNSTFAPIKLDKHDLWKSFKVHDGELIISEAISINSYLAADLAEFLRQTIVAASLSFSFETVMSDARKIDFLRATKNSGYRIYLNYFSTKDPMININRVGLRIEKQGHAVDPSLIEKRYYRS
jgi:hypothetical protein